VTAEPSTGPIGTLAHLAVVPEADPIVIASRPTERVPHKRFQLTPGSSHAEAHFYRQACDRHIQSRYDVLRVEVGTHTPDQIAAQIHDRLSQFFAPTDDQETTHAQPW
jgi:dTMP kinase